MTLIERIRARLFAPPPLPPIRGPWNGDRTGVVSSAPMMPAGSVISCPNDHWLYRLTCDLESGMVMKSAQIVNIEDMAPVPVGGQPVDIKCPYCQEPWRRLVATGLTVSAVGCEIGPMRWQTHFTTGWWPAVSEQEPTP